MENLLIYSNYGFDQNWNLEISYKDKQGIEITKNFYLGQDSKFCTRILGLSPSQVCLKIGSNDLRLQKTRLKLAKFIKKELGINKANYLNIEPWQFSAN